MAIDTLRRLLLFAGLCLAQVLVLNRIQLFHCATPLLYVYFVITFARNYPRWAILLWSFALGLCVDVCSNTPGMAAASLTLVGFVQPRVLELFLPREAEENMKVSAAGLGFSKFLVLALILVIIHCTAFFTLEMFHFAHVVHWLLCIVGSTVVTLVLIMTLESLRK